MEPDRQTVFQRGKMMTRSVFIAIAGIVTATIAMQLEGSEPVTSSPRFPIPARVIEVKDGDTIAVDLVLPWDVTLRAQDLRENSYDAWESSKRRHSSAVGGEVTDAEVAKGKLAAEFLKSLLTGGKVFVEPAHSEKLFGDRDVYGRVLGKLWVFKDGKWIDVAEEMNRKGHVRK
jgi:endonuclease YncB( thermonuclease family)